MEQRLGGLILLKFIPSDGTGEFLWTHSSETMCVSYMSDAERRPVVLYAVNTVFLINIFCICSLPVKMNNGLVLNMCKFMEEGLKAGAVLTYFTFDVILSSVLVRVLKN